MAIAVHIENTPNTDARTAYEAGWQELNERGARDPVGRQSHTAWIVGDVLHVLDVWDSQEHLDAGMQIIGPVIEQSGMAIAGPPKIGEVLQIITPR